MNEVKEKKKIGLTTRIFIALIAGAIVGIALNMFAADVDFVQNVLVNGIFYVVGQGFIRLMQMLVVPLVFCSLICGATAIGDSKTLGKVGVKIIGFYIFTTMMAVAVALGIGLLIKPGMGLDMSQIQTRRSRRFFGFGQLCGNPAEHHPEKPDRCTRQRRNAAGYRVCTDRRRYPRQAAG